MLMNMHAEITEKEDLKNNVFDKIEMCNLINILKADNEILHLVL